MILSTIITNNQATYISCGISNFSCVPSRYLGNLIRHSFVEGLISARPRDVSYYYNKNKTKSIGVSKANYSCIWFLNGGTINSYQ